LKKKLLTLQKNNIKLNAIGNLEEITKISAKGTPDELTKQTNK
jgi:hypothetical protein